MKHVHLRALALALCLGLLAPAAFAQLKFAVVDVQRAVMETEDGLRASATLKKFFDKRQQELDAKQNEMQKRMEDWQRQMMELQTVFVEYNKELQKKQGELTQPIYGKIMGLLRRLATQDGYDAILEKQAVPYMRNDLDLTDRIIQLYNSGASGGSPAS